MSDEDDKWEKFRERAKSRIGQYYGRKGEPLTLEQWAIYHNDLEYRRVGYDEVPATHKNPASYVSTVWLGLDHSFFMQGPPIIFETMRFEVEATQESKMLPTRKYHRSLEFPDPDDGELTEQVRYCTEEQASIGHKSIMRRIQETEMS